MAVKLITQSNRYIGTSADVKPTSPPAASSFIETDTGVEYIYNGAAWVVYYSSGAMNGGIIWP